MKQIPTVSIDELNDPEISAAMVGLNYVTGDAPGISRERSGKRFRYRDPSGKLVRDEKTLGRIKSLVIPPAWTHVWICSHANGHLQATGRDERGRKQFRYHPRWREIRDETKYARMIEFARTLPRIRRRVDQDLARKGLPREKVLAAIVRLLEASRIRVGNDEYARENHSFGLTTFRNQHVAVNGSTLRFHFRGKVGKWHNVDIADRRLAKIVKRCQDLPGQELFQFVDDEGQRHDVRSEDVNAYLHEISGKEFTAKDFRTWAGTMLAAIALREFEKHRNQTEAKRNVVLAIKSVSQQLGNTPAVCKKCYIHPHILDSYMEGTLVKTLKKRISRGLSPAVPDLQREESAVLNLLQHRRTVEEKLSAAISKEQKTRTAKNSQAAHHRK